MASNQAVDKCSLDSSLKQVVLKAVDEKMLVSSSEIRATPDPCTFASVARTGTSGMLKAVLSICRGGAHQCLEAWAAGGKFRAAWRQSEFRGRQLRHFRTG